MYAPKVKVLKLGLAEHVLKTNTSHVHNRIQNIAATFVPITILYPEQRPFLLDARILFLKFIDNPQPNAYEYKYSFTFSDDILKQQFSEENQPHLKIK